LNDPMIYVRAAHFAATITVAGVAFFIVFIAEPAFRKAGENSRIPALIRPTLAWLAWGGLALGMVSGAAWLVLVARSMSDIPIAEVFSQGILRIVLLHTGFGRDWLTRFVLACLIAGMFVPFLPAKPVRSVWLNLVVVVLAAGLVGTLAWAGHAVGGSGNEGIVHPVADFLHLVAAAAWVGTLVPLALLLAVAGRDTASLSIARAATMRFSACGIASVATLLVTGTINTWYLAGSIPALTQTDYGQLLLIKVALFLGMVAVAAVNRLRLAPRLVHETNATAGHDALRQLRRNVAIEVAAGTAVIAIVAVLGMTPPGLHADIAVHALNHSH
jgi:putative copper resistance protein D